MEKRMVGPWRRSSLEVQRKKRLVKMVGVNRMVTTWRRCRGGKRKESSRRTSGEPQRWAMARRTRHEISEFIRRGGGRIHRMTGGGQLGVMKKEKKVSAVQTRKRVIAGEPR